MRSTWPRNAAPSSVMRIERVVRSNSRADSSSSSDWIRFEIVPGVRPSSVPTADRFCTAATRANMRISWMSIPAPPRPRRPSPCSPKAWAAHTQHCYFVLLYVASNTVAAKEAPFKPESGHYVSCVARTSRTTRRRAPQEIDSHQIFRPTLARPRTAGGLTLPAGILEALEQPLEIFELQRLPRGLAQAPAQLLEDLSRALDVDLVGHLDAHSGIGTLRALRRPPHGIQLATRVAETVARRHPAQHLLRHLPRTLPQLLERTRLLLGGTVEIALAQCALRALHGLARTTELARRIETEVVEAPLQAAQHVAQLALPIPQRTQLLITRTIALALALPLALLTLTLALLALPPLAALPLLTTVALAALLVERIVEQ